MGDVQVCRFYAGMRIVYCFVTALIVINGDYLPVNYSLKVWLYDADQTIRSVSRSLCCSVHEVCTKHLQSFSQLPTISDRYFLTQA